MQYLLLRVIFKRGIDRSQKILIKKYLLPFFVEAFDHHHAPGIWHGLLRNLLAEGVSYQDRKLDSVYSNY